MAIKEKEIWIAYSPRTAKYFENKGYIFPTYKNKDSKSVLKKNAKILVKIEDLSKGSNIKVTKICDICGNEILNTSYSTILATRNRSNDKLDRCFKCGKKKAGETLSIANIDNCIATTQPEFAKLFWNKEDTLIRTHGSGKKADFKCLNCNNKVENKIIASVYKNGLSCVCKDNISYPEKFMYSVLKQLNVEFEYQKIFDWSKNIKTNNLILNGRKIYDFYLNKLNIIIETHGDQHFNQGFKSTKRKTLKEEQENDKIKKILALGNGIEEENYIVINCCESEMEFIKSSILESELNLLFDLSKIDWVKSHEFACNSLVKKASDLFNNGFNVFKITNLTKLSRQTIIRYLKKGTELGFCNYNAKEEVKKGSSKNGKKRRKPIIQLSMNGEFIKEWESAWEVMEELGINNVLIGQVCMGKQISTNNFKWMYKEDYSPQKALEIGKIKKYEKKKKPIIQLSVSEKFIREWDGAIDIEKELRICSKNIGAVCRGKVKTAGGYKWMFKEDYCQKKKALIPMDLIKDNEKQII